MGSVALLLVYLISVLALVVLLVVLAIRFVKAHERGAIALEEIASQLARANWNARSGG